MPPARALKLLDRALVADRPNVIAAHLDQAVLAQRDEVPAVLSALAPQRKAAVAATRPAAPAADLPTRLATVGAAQRYELVREAVHATVTVVLGGGQISIGEDTSFKELGFDSLTAVELRNRLGKQTGLRLPATVVFDHPNPAALTSYLLGLLAPDDGLAGEEPEPPTDAPQTGLDDATPEELFHFIDSQLRGWEGEVSR
jgi:acyl carrier protein